MAIESESDSKKQLPRFLLVNAKLQCDKSLAKAANGESVTTSNRRAKNCV